jgi:uncharacterized protein (PEP-CTERM system associated)
MGPEAIARRIVCVVLAAASAGLSSAPGAQTPSPKDARLFPQEVPAAAAQDAAKADAQDAADANPRDAPTVAGGQEAGRPEGAVAPARPTARRTLVPWRVIPRIAVSETYSDNVSRTAAASAQGDWISALSPGFRVEGAGPRLRGFLDYQLSKYLYASQSGLNNTQNAMNSELALEAIQDWLFIDARAVISQQNRSAFGTTTTDATGANSNRSESSVFQLSPHVRGVIADTALYQLRYSGATSRTHDSIVPETRTSEWVGNVKNAPSASLLGWSVDASTVTIRNAIADRDDSRFRGSLMYALYPELHVSISEGIESSNLAGLGRQRTLSPAIGLDWSPGARTQVAVVREKRFFGTGHSLLLSHRTPLLALRFSDVRDVSLPVQITASGPGTISGLLNELLTSSISDPAARAAAVRSQLEQTGIPGSSPGSAGFLTTGATLARRQAASVAVLGKTNTVTLSWNRSNFQSIGGSLGLIDNVTSTTQLSQEGYSAAWAVRLSPLSSMTLVESWLNAKDLSAASFSSKLHSQNLAFLTQIGPKASLSVGTRRVRFDSTVVGGYTENALFGTAAWHY